MDADVDALIIGGASAGLSAGLVLGRARVDTLVIDAGEPSNRTALAIGGLLGQEGTSPEQLYAAGRSQLAPLPTVELRTGVVTGIQALGDDSDPLFTATLADGDQVIAKRVVLAGGMRYVVPDVPGLAELWGRTAFMCPYCHGWEHRDQKIAILGAAGAAHRVALLSSWSKDLIVLSDGDMDLDERTALLDAGIPVSEEPIAAVAPGLVRFANGSEQEIDALHVVAPMEPRDRVAADLGLTTTDQPNGRGFIKVDASGLASTVGVFAAGDAAGAGNVAGAIASGSLAAASLHRTLIDERDI
jgi:thioredoxin reductase